MKSQKIEWRRKIFLHFPQNLFTSRYAHPSQDFLSPHLQHPINPNFSFDRNLQAVLYGRRLLEIELKTFSDATLREHWLNGYIQMTPALVKEYGRYQCLRCGNHQADYFSSYQCGRCGEECTYCRACLTLGVVKSCSKLITWAGPPIENSRMSNLKLQWEGQLTSRQQQAADQLVKAIQEGEDFMIWAVTGAGKTEILYPALKLSVEQAKKVAVVSPRTDVVIELAKRLKRVFADTSVNVLYGDSPETYHPSAITLATTHQLLRFYQYFDAVFIDEVDAFPFHNNPMLHYALEHSLKPQAPRYYLTATPTPELKTRFEKGRLHGIRIPVRFHGFPLPVPTFDWIGNWRKALSRDHLPTKIVRWTEHQLDAQRQAFLFVPSIEVLEALLPLFKRISSRIEGVHSEDALRHQKVEAFRKGEIPLLLTTTILERGVTIPFLDVAVLGAEDPIFDERALVQLSGRVGRDARDPAGKLTYFHYGVTWQMVKAREHIRKMNTLAKTLK